MSDFVDGVTGSEWSPVIWIIIVTIVLIVIARWVLARRAPGAGAQFKRQAIMVGIATLGFVAAILNLPDTVEPGLALSALGLVVTGALAISSQSIIANGMAGLMLRSIENFRPGDFIEIGDHAGRVSETGLFHTEIQSPDRDLITVPNSLMVTEPVRVIRKDGTIVSARIGLGYDLSRHRLKPIFLKAAETAGLEGPFVQVVDLGDYAVTYRVAGFLRESTEILATRSRLREALLDALSEADIEIMSPMYVARRSVGNDPLIPEQVRPNVFVENRPTAEALVFDKAEQAAGVQELRDEIEAARAELDELKDAAPGLGSPDADAHRARVEEREVAIQQMSDRLETAEAAQETEA